jgi:Asp-tRNA(Asn)/Glu-tRNA(Gln) amidotransferase A subunit family amidase
MARSVEDCAILLQAMAGHDPKDDSSSTLPVPDYRTALGQNVRGLRVGVPRAQFFTGLQDGVRTAVENALTVLEELGMSIQEIDVPNLDEFGAVSLGILGPEAAAYHQQWLRERPDDYSPDVLNRLQASMAIPAVDYVMAQQGRARLTERFIHIMEQVDVLVTPTEPITAPRIGDSTVVLDGEERTAQGLLTLLTRPFNVTGMPAISVPCGFDERGLPVGLQIVGRPFDEATVLQAAHAYETATSWHTMRPDL